MRPRAYERLSAQLNTLENMTNSQERGIEFEQLLAAAFAAEQFIVHSNFHSAGGSQVDLVASRGSLTLLVEAKWRSRKAGPNDVNRLLDRLESSPSAVAGVLVSMSGFTATVADRVKQKGKTPILLLDGHELRTCVRGASLYDLLISKLDYLARRQEVLMSASPGSWGGFSDVMGGSALELLLPGQRETRWWESCGGYSDTVFALDLHDVDWGAGEGVPVECDLHFPVGNSLELSHLISRLKAFDWLSSESAWKFEQASVSWNGFGTTTLLQALLAYQDRYRGREMHHTERMILTDQFDAGILTLTADVSASENRMVTRCQVSLQLPGVPLDTSAIQTLAREHEVSNYPTFRPINRPSITTHALRAPRRANRQTSLPLEHRAVGEIVRVEDLSTSAADLRNETRSARKEGDTDERPDRVPGLPGGRQESWVVGVLLDDPFPRSARARVELGLPPERMGPVCASLRSHHLPHDKNTYSLLRVEQARTSEANVFRLICDW